MNTFNVLNIKKKHTHNSGIVSALTEHSGVSSAGRGLSVQSDLYLGKRSESPGQTLRSWR